MWLVLKLFLAKNPQNDNVFGRGSQSQNKFSRGTPETKIWVTVKEKDNPQSYRPVMVIQDHNSSFLFNMIHPMLSMNDKPPFEEYILLKNTKCQIRQGLKDLEGIRADSEHIYFKRSVCLSVCLSVRPS